MGPQVKGSTASNSLWSISQKKISGQSLPSMTHGQVEGLLQGAESIIYRSFTQWASLSGLEVLKPMTERCSSEWWGQWRKPSGLHLLCQRHTDPGPRELSKTFPKQDTESSQCFYKKSAPRSWGPTQRVSGEVYTLRKSNYRKRTLERIYPFLPYKQIQIHKTICTIGTFSAHGIIYLFVYKVFTKYYIFVWLPLASSCLNPWQSLVNFSELVMVVQERFLRLCKCTRVQERLSLSDSYGPPLDLGDHSLKLTNYSKCKRVLDRSSVWES